MRENCILSNVNLVLIFQKNDVKGFTKLNDSNYIIGNSCVVCNTKTLYKIADNIYAIPISAI